MKILIAGDNHCNYDIITELNYKYEQFDLKLHTGDSQFDLFEIDNLNDWIKVCGNNDFLGEKILPKYKVIETQYGNILLTHGHLYNVNFEHNLETLQLMAKKLECKFIVYGHTHILDVRKLNDFIIINPSSTTLPRNPRTKTYVELTLSNEQIKVIVKNIDGTDYETFKF